MSTAHRPTWTPAQGKMARGNSRVYSSRDMAAQTKLKFRQPGQGTTTEIGRKDLKVELDRAEKRHRNGGKEEPQQAITGSEKEDEQVAKRRKILEEAAVLDKDDSDDDQAKSKDKGKGKAVEENGDAQPVSADESSDSDSDDEDETAELLRELEKIKRERAEEKLKLDSEQASADASDRDAHIAMGNPLLNLQAALAGGVTPGGASSYGGSNAGYTVKRRWNDDTVFKNQAVSEKPRQEFVNDLLRTEFHKRFLKKFIA